MMAPLERSFPDVAPTGLTLVTTSFGPTEGSLLMDLLFEAVAPTDTVVLVTADRRPADSIGAYERRFTGADSPDLAVVDVTADQQYADVYHDVTVVGVPGSGDPTRTLVGIGDVATDARRTADTVHVLIPDLGPFLRNPGGRVRRMLRSLLAEPGIDGSVVAGLRYTAHGAETVDALQPLASRVIVAERTTDGGVQAAVSSSLSTGRRDRTT